MFCNANQSGSLSVKLWRGERMCLIGMDVTAPEADFVGFSIEVKAPGAAAYVPLQNRLNFAYDKPVDQAVDGSRNFDSTSAPFQKFRWIHFPWNLVDGSYLYRVTKLHMKADGSLMKGDQVADLDIPLDAHTYGDYLDVGFTRNFASSQAYAETYGNNPNILPGKGVDPLTFDKTKLPAGVYPWLGFEAYDLIFGILDEVANDPALSLDILAYDFDEPDVLAKLLACGSRVRAVIDNSGTHAPATSAPSQAAARLQAAGAAVTRMHFKSLQHNKVLIVKQNGTPQKVLLGSTNFSFRGLYIQANNCLVFYSPDAAALYAQVFELAFQGGEGFASQPIATKWSLVQPGGDPIAHFCFSPHSDMQLSLGPVGAAIDQASSSVFFAIAFLNQIRSGPTHDAIDRLMGRDVFSYGIVDKDSGLEVRKPDGSVGLVDFAYLAGKAPEPFKTEWSGGAGIHQHDKFVVTDFSLPTAKVFTGSSNLSPAGETGNGDNLVMIEDQRVATSFAIEALRVFDHLQFRSRMQAANGQASALTLAKPTALSGQPVWFERYYVQGGQMERDRLLFSH